MEKVIIDGDWGGDDQRGDIGIELVQGIAVHLRISTMVLRFDCVRQSTSATWRTQGVSRQGSTAPSARSGVEEDERRLAESLTARGMESPEMRQRANMGYVRRTAAKAEPGSTRRRSPRIITVRYLQFLCEQLSQPY